MGIRTLHLQWIGSREIPLFPGAEKVDSYVRPFPAEGGLSIRFTLRTAAEVEEVVQFYESELIKRGWKKGPRNLRSHHFGGTPHWFEKSGSRMSIHLSDRSLRYREGYNQVEVTYYIH